MSTSAAAPQPTDTSSGPARRFVQVIDLYTSHPAELERLLHRWRTTSLAREHIAEVELERADDGHVVLAVEFETSTEPSAGGDELQEGVSEDAAAVVALLDRAPVFRSVGRD